MISNRDLRHLAHVRTEYPDIYPEFVAEHFPELAGINIWDETAIRNVRGREPEWVYLIHSGELPKVKIGRTGDIKGRLQVLRNASGDSKLRYIGHFQSFNAGAAEKALHRRFADMRAAAGEWFNVPSLDRLREIMEAFALSSEEWGYGG